MNAESILINSFLSVPLLTGALFLCYNIVGMFVRFHPIPRVKPFFGAAFFVCCKFTTILSET
ncbi:unknown [Lactococcus phage Tuc2009]|uniref:bacterioholin n=1 Tax=Lactococcus phage Tuc2009 TaxID=35241 RepID=UPI000009B19A|nr:bacteriophage holin [Lactococcus cremoris]NP_108735.1 bacterioholin [Lactococcus phage Tuc2009]NP_695078.1 bacterioholin [Lactococcus phage r1t]AAA32609.1 unknown [Lactococcus phage Tuc2009]AAB18725.1 ORF50 [Lactococcus phage r1t]MBU8903720.1 bacteriophage holin [Lactococcus cremoris]